MTDDSAREVRASWTISLVVRTDEALGGPEKVVTASISGSWQGGHDGTVVCVARSAGELVRMLQSSCNVIPTCADQNEETKQASSAFSDAWEE